MDEWGVQVAAPIHPAKRGTLDAGCLSLREILSSSPLIKSISLGEKSPLAFCLGSLPDVWELCTEERMAVDKGKVEGKVWGPNVLSSFQINCPIFSLTCHSSPPSQNFPPLFMLSFYLKSLFIGFIFLSLHFVNISPVFCLIEFDGTYNPFPPFSLLLWVHFFQHFYFSIQ